MTSLFDPIEPYQKHRLQVSPLHNIYFEESGNPNGKPILFLHGGPGGGTEPDHRRLYDPQVFRIILVDQRGCGLSTPFACVEENTTFDLVKDLEAIRETLKIEAWLVHGGSWGSTLALTYAILHAPRVLGLVLRGIFLCTQKELHWLYQEGAHFVFPEEWDKYSNFIPPGERHDFIKAYHSRLFGEDEHLKLEAARIWSQWEASSSKLIPSSDFIKKYGQAQKALPFARIESHYFFNRAFFKSDNYLLENASALKDIPTIIVHGRYDMVCPVKSAWDLHRALPKSQLRIIPDAGHSLYEPGILSEVIKACHELGVRT